MFWFLHQVNKKRHTVSFCFGGLMLLLITTVILSQMGHFYGILPWDINNYKDPIYNYRVQKGIGKVMEIQTGAKESRNFANFISDQGN